jgi:hypothetical protein
MNKPRDKGQKTQNEDKQNKIHNTESKKEEQYGFHQTSVSEPMYSLRVTSVGFLSELSALETIIRIQIQIT